MRVSMRIPPLDSQDAVLPGIGQSSWTDVMLMMRPPPPCFASSSAIALPMPLLPPVTMATFPVRLMP